MHAYRKRCYRCNHLAADSYNWPVIKNGEIVGNLCDTCHEDYDQNEPSFNELTEYINVAQ